MLVVESCHRPANTLYITNVLTKLCSHSLSQVGWIKFLISLMGQSRPTQWSGHCNSIAKAWDSIPAREPIVDAYSEGCFNKTGTAWCNNITTTCVFKFLTILVQQGGIRVVRTVL